VPRKSIVALVCVLGVFAASRAEAGDYYMVAQHPRSFVFVDEGEIGVPASGMRVIGVIKVFEGAEAVDLGYKFLHQDLAFSCKNKRVAVYKTRTFGADHHLLTQGGISAAHDVKEGTDEAKVFSFVCEDDRSFADYYREDPGQAADKLYALLRTPR
jgi:hypothetical protein